MCPACLGTVILGAVVAGATAVGGTWAALRRILRRRTI
jgi:hypothetical protein